MHGPAAAGAGREAGRESRPGAGGHVPASAGCCSGRGAAGSRRRLRPRAGRPGDPRERGAGLRAGRAAGGPGSSPRSRRPPLPPPGPRRRRAEVRPLGQPRGVAGLFSGGRRLRAARRRRRAHGRRLGPPAGGGGGLPAGPAPRQRPPKVPPRARGPSGRRGRGGARHAQKGPQQRRSRRNRMVPAGAPGDLLQRVPRLARRAPALGPSAGAASVQRKRKRVCVGRGGSWRLRAKHGGESRFFPGVFHGVLARGPRVRPPIEPA